jgi:predicted transcriptional regulator
MNVRHNPETEESIRAKIEEGYAEAQRGELLSEDEVRGSMNEHKKLWLENRRLRGAAEDASRR